MRNQEKEVMLEELASLIQAQEGEFIIHVELGEGDSYGVSETVPT